MLSDKSSSCEYAGCLEELTAEAQLMGSRKLDSPPHLVALLDAQHQKRPGRIGMMVNLNDGHSLPDPACLGFFG